VRCSPLVYREHVGPEDLSAIRRLVSGSGFFNPQEQEVAVELLEERLQRGQASGYHFLLADCSGAVAGFTCYGPIPGTAASFDLYWIVVDAELRGQGIGRALLRRTEALIAQQQGRRVYVETSAREQYRSTCAFYERCGYGQEALLSDFYAPGDDKVILVKVLPSAELSSRRAEPDSGSAE
jgi:ribosomal protein S18 acetylase RimI-like enzyme